MAIKEYSLFSNPPGFEPNYQIQFSVMSFQDLEIKAVKCIFYQGIFTQPLRHGQDVTQGQL